MPLILYPDVPAYPGVPALVRGANVPVGIQVALGEIQTLLASAMQSPFQWGIFDSQGNQLGITSQGNGLFKSIVSFIFGVSKPILSTNAFEYVRDTKISDFPVQRGGFATYNKVVMPAEPIVTLALQGSVIDRTMFLNQLEAATQSTELFSIATPEFNYYNYSIERYNLIRRAESGATLIVVEIALKEIREISVAYTTVQTPIANPQSPASTPQSNSGLVQPQGTANAQTSALKSIVNAASKLWPNLGDN